LAEIDYDVIVVGAGPAGSAASMICAEAGLKTILIESQSFGRDKLCAGGVSPWVIRRLEVPGSLIERTIEQVQVVAGSKKIPVIPWPDDMAYRMVMRKEFDFFLVRKAKEAGSMVKDRTRVCSVLKNAEEKVCGVRSSGGDVKARIVIGCDGASSVVARTSGLWEKWWSRGAMGEGWRNHQAFCLETQTSLDSKMIESRVGSTMTLLFEKDFPGYYWIFPKRNVLTVGALSLSFSVGAEELKERMKRIIKYNSVASNILRGAKMAALKGAYLPIHGPLYPSFGDGLMVAGDSASHVGAVWGEGIYFAVRAGIAAGETAIQAIRNDDVSKQFLKAYEERWKREIGNNLSVQAKILNEAPTPLHATISFAEYLIKEKSRLYP
jgi:geranylgeranyl reductase family protein